MAQIFASMLFMQPVKASPDEMAQEQDARSLRRSPPRSVHSSGPTGPILLVTIVSAALVLVQKELVLRMPPGYSAGPSRHSAHDAAS